MESKFIDHTNKKWLWTHLDTEEEVNEVCEYLINNNLKIELIGDFEYGFKGNGQKVMLEGVDLSGNGFGFKGCRLLLHVRYFQKLKSISETDEFEDWIAKYELFSLVKIYVVEKDQAWINIDDLKSLGLTTV